MARWVDPAIPTQDTKLKILLVEDNPGDVRLLREALAEAGTAQFELTHLERLGDALKAIGEEPFDVALLDLSLPDSQGLETFLTFHASAPQVPTVVMTGLDDEAFAVKALRAGAQDYLVKGQVDGKTLARVMRHSMVRKQAGEGQHG